MCNMYRRWTIKKESVTMVAGPMVMMMVMAMETQTDNDDNCKRSRVSSQESTRNEYEWSINLQHYEQKLAGQNVTILILAQISTGAGPDL